MKILGDDAGRDVEHLRAAYRAAALRCHPDRGGLHDDMIAVNRAFEMLHRLLVEEAGAEPIVGGDGESLGSSGETTNALAYLWTVRRLLFGIALDEWAIEEAFAYLEELVPVRAPRPAKVDVPENPFLIDNPEAERKQRTFDLFEQACRLTIRLCAAGRTESAARSLAVAREAFRVGPQGPYCVELVRKAEECVAGTRRPQFALESVRQVENAFRLGAIDEKRYKASLSRVTRTANRVEADRRERLAILARTHFTPLLPIDAKLNPSRIAGRMVPHPEPYIEKAEDLTPDQQAMYLAAFRSADDLDLVGWYARFRLDSALRSVIFLTNRCDLASLAEEAEALARLGSCGWLGRATADLILFIAALEGTPRAEFVSQLAKRVRGGYAQWVLEAAWKLAEKFGVRTADEFELRAMWHEAR